MYMYEYFNLFHIEVFVHLSFSLLRLVLSMKTLKEKVLRKRKRMMMRMMRSRSLERGPGLLGTIVTTADHPTEGKYTIDIRGERS